jgi:hypothetical protein
MNLKKLERYLQVNSLGPGPRLIETNLPGRGLTKVDKHSSKAWQSVETSVWEKYSNFTMNARVSS